MKQNPCRYCCFGFLYKKQYVPSNNKECGECENIKAHREYLVEQRKFEKGEQIRTFNELIEQEWVLFMGKGKHIKVILNMQATIVLSFLEKGYFYKAIRKENGGN